MNKIFIPFFFLFIHTFIHAQIIGGKVIDSETKAILPYVNIGILHKSIGTVSDANGNFQLNISKASSADTLKISFIGYTPFILPLNAITDSSLLQNKTFDLDPNPNSLSEVVITPGKIRTTILGNKTQNSLVSMAFAPIDLGAEIGTVLKYHRKNAGQIENVNFYFQNSDYDSLVFRINIYDFKNGTPGESVLNEPIYVTAKFKQGMLSVDLRDKNIFIHGDSFISLEWIGNSGGIAVNELSESKVWFAAGFFNNDSYGRTTSQSDWHKIQEGLGFWATVSYKKK